MVAPELDASPAAALSVAQLELEARVLELRVEDRPHPGDVRVTEDAADGSLRSDRGQRRQHRRRQHQHGEVYNIRDTKRRPDQGSAGSRVPRGQSR